MKLLYTYRETLQGLPACVQCAHHELRGKCLGNTEIPPECAVALLHRLGQSDLRFGQSSYLYRCSLRRS